MPSGIVNLDKPKGLSSQKTVTVVRGRLGAGKAGHCGTLDPDASGVLLVCLDQATRLADYFQSLPKEYRAVLHLGVETDTEDASGQVTGQMDAGHITESDVREAMKGFIGEIEQVPPMYSALKLEGRPLYELARRGITVDRAPRRVRVDSIEMEPMEGPLVTLSIRCSKGTYIRTLCADIGRKLGVGGHMAGLVRTAVGKFRIENAVSLERLEASSIIPPADALDFLPSGIIAPDFLKRVLHGNPIPIEGVSFSPAEVVPDIFRIFSDDGDFLGTGRRDGYLMRIERLLGRSTDSPRLFDKA